MRLFKQYHMAYSKKDSVFDLVQRVRSFLDELGVSNPDILFCFIDHITGLSPAVERAVKKIPYLSEFEFQMSGTAANGIRDYRVLSNLPTYWKEANPNNKCMNVNFNIIEEIVRGIPKPCNFNYATIIFDKIPWSGNVDIDSEYVNYKSMKELWIGTTEPISAENPFAHPDGFNKIYPSPSIIIQSNWGFYHRYSFIGALVEIDVPDANCDKIPELDEKVMILLSKLGKPAAELLVAVPSYEEQARIELSYPIAQKFTNEIQDNFGEILPNISLPYKLYGLQMVSPYTSFDQEETVSIKQSILKILKPLGYKYQNGYSGQGGYYITKKTPANNQIKLFLNTGKFSKDLSCRFIFEGPFYSHWLEIREFAPGWGNMLYSIRNQKAADEILSNIGAIVSYLEEALVKKLDDLYPDTPKWYDYQK